MKHQGITRVGKAKRREAGRTALGWLIDPDNDSVALDALQCAGITVRRKLQAAHAGHAPWGMRPEALWRTWAVTMTLPTLDCRSPSSTVRKWSLRLGWVRRSASTAHRHANPARRLRLPRTGTQRCRKKNLMQPSAIRNHDLAEQTQLRLGHCFQAAFRQCAAAGRRRVR